LRGVGYSTEGTIDGKHYDAGAPKWGHRRRSVGRIGRYFSTSSSRFSRRVRSNLEC
jgi:hypothetical protein